ncbi:MAG: efflux RND transporter periplasmic adaptor subunit [Pirellulaceae bacterium]
MIALLALLAGCQPENTYAPPPPPPVTVAKPRVQSVTAYREETGRTEASDFVEVRARVKGFLKKIHFQPNDEVKAGQLLYEIEPDLYQAAFNQAVAASAVAKAEHANAVARYDRAAKLLESSAIAKEEVEQRRAEMEVAAAQIEAAEANIEAAQLDLNYTKVTAPISGQIGKTEVYEGNLVGDGQASLLTRIVKFDPMFATFTVSEDVILNLLDEIAENPQDREKSREKIRLFLRRDIDNDFPFEGRINFADLAVDPSTATYRVRGEFPNPDTRLVEGLFVRVRLPITRRENALLIPQRAVGADPVGSYVFVIDEKNVVSRKDVVLSTRLGSLVVVDSGLTAEDRVIIDGLQRAQIDKKVEPIDGEIPEAKDLWEPPATNSETGADQPSQE